MSTTTTPPDEATQARLIAEAQAMTPPDQATQARLIAESQARFDERLRKTAEHIEKLRATNGYSFGGPAILQAYVAYDILTCIGFMLIPGPSRPADFNGKAYGFGVGGGTGWGAGHTAYDMEGLVNLGEIDYNLDFVGGLIQINWFTKDLKYVAEASLTGINVGLGGFIGSGSWTWSKR